MVRVWAVEWRVGGRVIIGWEGEGGGEDMLEGMVRDRRWEIVVVNG